MMKKRILIGVDHKWRDLAGYSVLRWMLETFFNCEARLIREGCEHRVLYAFRPHVLVVNHLFSRQRAQSLHLPHRHGLRIAVLPTEGIPTLPQNYELTAGKFTDMSVVDLHFSWGDRFRRILQEKGGFPENKIEVIGVPRFDFYHPGFRRLVNSREEFLKRYMLDPGRKSILWTTNFTHAGFYKKREDFLVRDYTNLGLTKVDFFKDPVALARKDFESRRIAVEFLQQLVRELPNCNILLKPHPSEDHSFYQEVDAAIQKESPGRFGIIYNEYIWDALAACDILLERSCTTGIEAWILGLPTIEMQLNPTDYYFSEQHAGGSVIVRSPAEALSAIGGFLNGGAIPEPLLRHRQAFIQDWCKVVDGQRTYACARRLAELAENAPRMAGPLRFIRNPKTLLSSYLGEWLGRPEYEPVWPRRSTPQEAFDHLGRRDKWVTCADREDWARRIGNAEESLRKSAK